MISAARAPRADAVRRLARLLRPPCRRRVRVWARAGAGQVNDEYAAVRAAALSRLSAIYRSSGVEPTPLANFTQRFEERFVEMVCDTDKAVAIEALRLFSVLKSHDALTVHEKALRNTMCVPTRRGANGTTRHRGAADGWPRRLHCGGAPCLARACALIAVPPHVRSWPAGT
jgi:hypothetical protein